MPTRRPKANSSASIAQLLNLGPKSAAVLAETGITSLEQLKRLGAVSVYYKAKRGNPAVTLNLLWALEGAILVQPWRQVAREHRTSLLLALEDHERAVKPF